jgi:nitroreductase
MGGQMTVTPAGVPDDRLARPSGGSALADGRPTAGEVAVIDWLLSTTRSFRRTLDLTRPVPPSVIETCLRLALQAPTSHNSQGWHWMVVTDPDKRAIIADAYRRSYEGLTRNGERRPRVRRWHGASRDVQRDAASAAWLVNHLAEVPVHVIPCLLRRPPPTDASIERSAAYWASIYPAVWSFQLALRSRGLGSVLTVVHLALESEVAAALGIPDAVTQTCLLPVAYTTMWTFAPAKRVPLEQRISWNSWQGKQ